MKTLLWAGALSATMLAGSAGAWAAESCKIAWSHYTGWEPAGYIQDKGIADKWGQQMGVDLSFTLINDYIESVNQYTVGSFDGVTVTNMDALTIPAVGGVDTTLLVIGDFSNGNDGILLKGVMDGSIKALAGREVKLVELSVSHYLLARALDMNGMSEKDLTLVNTSDADMGALIGTASDGDAFVTWNPILMTGRNVAGVEMLFDSSKIPGEIIDTIAVRSDASVACKKAVAGAWYEAMAVMAGAGPETEEALAFMAAQAGGSLGEFKAQLRTTRMFYEGAAAADFARSDQVKQTMDYVRQFSFDRGLYGQGAASPDSVGIAFPDGSVLGDAGNIKLRFDDSYMRAAGAR
ncbi:MAG: putative urea ABC transporter substrate-binding protein [Magnetospiraceae bacterium]